MDTSEDFPPTRGKRRRVEDPHLAFVVDGEVVKGHAQWWGFDVRPYLDANHAFPIEGADAAIPAWAAAEGSKD